MTKQIDKIMEQAQVFASAWSLVGGRFDNGNMLDEAKSAKDELRQMVTEALAGQPAQHECRCNQGQVCHVCDPIEQPAQQEPVSFLANGTRFKMSFFDCAEPEGDEHGESDVGTYVTCFEAFAKELDGRWVALVAAEDDCHLKLTSPQAQRTFVELTDDEFYAVIRPFYGTDESCHAAMRISLDEYKAIEAKLKEKNT